MRTHGKFVVPAALLLALTGTSIALGAGEGGPLQGGVRNPSSNETQEFNRETEIIANNATYGTRQSNKSNNGGGAIYGCRSRAGGTPANNEPCLRANNLADGLAFEFETDGALGGTINAARPGDGARPFTTNATGVATGLNADRVDGRDAADLLKDALQGAQALSPGAIVNADGTTSSSRGVPTGGVSRSAQGNYDVVFNGDLTSCPVTATLAGTSPGFVTVTPAVAADKKTTTVDVRTFNQAGVATDRAFHIVAAC